MKTYDELTTIGKVSVWLLVIVSALVVIASLAMTVVYNIARNV